MSTTAKTMELKKVQNGSPVKDDVGLKKPKVRNFIEDLKKEFHSITWTSKEELLVYTKIVVGSTFVLGLGVYMVDLTIQLTLNMLTWITRLIGG